MRSRQFSRENENANSWGSSGGCMSSYIGRKSCANFPFRWKLREDLVIKRSTEACTASTAILQCAWYRGGGLAWVMVKALLSVCASSGKRFSLTALRARGVGRSSLARSISYSIPLTTHPPSLPASPPLNFINARLNELFFWPLGWDAIRRKTQK